MRKDGTVKWLRPDGKTQVTVEYKKEGGAVIPLRVHTILISTQHDEDVTNEQIHKDLMEHVIKPVSARHCGLPVRRAVKLTDLHDRLLSKEAATPQASPAHHSAAACDETPYTRSAGLPAVYRARACSPCNKICYKATLLGSLTTGIALVPFPTTNNQQTANAHNLTQL